MTTNDLQNTLPDNEEETFFKKYGKFNKPDLSFTDIDERNYSIQDWRGWLCFGPN